MRILELYKLEYIIDNSGLAIVPNLKQLKNISNEDFAGFCMIIRVQNNPTISKFLQLSSGTEVTYSITRIINKTSFLQKTKKYIQFENVENHSSFYCLVEDFEFVVNFIVGNDEFPIDNLIDTDVLKEFPQIISKYKSVQTTHRYEFPEEYYDQKYGAKSIEEKRLHKQALDAVNRNGSSGCDFASICYSKIIAINPEYAFAHFARSYYKLHWWELEKIKMSFGKKPKEKIEELENEILRQLRIDFANAVKLDPYINKQIEAFRRTSTTEF